MTARKRGFLNAHLGAPPQPQAPSYPELTPLQERCLVVTLTVDLAGSQAGWGMTPEQSDTLAQAVEANEALDGLIARAKAR